ncbi:MAG: hypothetical protein DMG76_11810 [Acidobacteria bacterium]|nr:MAG: hypothetical protein DMG76_11810 [Acidobacteriota bacterium]
MCEDYAILGWEMPQAREPPHPARFEHHDYFGCAVFLSNHSRGLQPAHVANTFVPTEALGAGIDRINTAATDKLFTEPVMKQVLSAGWQTVTYRQNTELFVEAWHWNPQGTWSDSSGKGYFVGNPKPGDFVRHSFGSLPATTFPCSLFASLSGSIAGLFSQQTATRSPYLGGQSKRLVRVLLRLLPTRMRLNAWPQVSRNNNQLANLVLGTSGRRDKP